MIDSARELDSGTELRADVCVIGAGAAGITLARALEGSGLDVLVLESGGEERDEATQQLYAGTTVEHTYFPPLVTRLRWLGGATNHWAGLCRPLTPIDLESRADLGRPGWPFGLDGLLPWYEAAHPVLGLGAFGYDPPALARAAGVDPPPAGHGLEPVAYRLTPEWRMGSIYRDELERARDVTLLLHANVTRIGLAQEADRVEQLDVGVLDGPGFVVRAGRYVLATGGLENARLLLASNDVRPAGVGNGSGHVGRWFADHPHVSLGRVVVDDATPTLLDTFHLVGDGLTRGALGLEARELRAEALPNAAVTVGFPEEHLDPEPDARGIAALFTGLEGRDTRVAGLTARIEAVPHPASRISLTRDRDALGLPRLAVEWRTGDEVYRVSETLGRRLGRLYGERGAGRVAFDLEPDEVSRPTGGHHHLGTTRMHHDPGKGVVDADLRVHEVGNLYVAGSSVFPSFGYANPTLTLTALALRLADHLRRGSP